MLMAIHRKPIVVGGGVFGEDGWPSALLLMTSLANGYHGNNDAYVRPFLIDKIKKYFIYMIHFILERIL